MRELILDWFRKWLAEHDFEGFEEAEAPIFPNYATSNQQFSLRLPYHEGTVFAFFRELWLASKEESHAA